MRNIDPETNWFFKEGYRDALGGMRPIVPDETRHTFQRSDYFAGYDAGSEARAAKAEAQIDEEIDYEPSSLLPCQGTRDPEQEMLADIA